MDNISAVLEIAGADAFAAAISYASTNPHTVMLPTYVHTGTEYGDFSVVGSHVDYLRRDLAERFSVKLLDLVVSADTSLWRALNGRFMTTIRDRFGFFSPCIGCHLYLHLMRIPEARRYDCGVVVAGERTTHASGSKINQTPSLLACYQEVLGAVGLSLEFPVRDIVDRAEIKALAPWLWEEGGEQMNCVLSGNYRLTDGTPIRVPEETEKLFIDEFLLPVGKRLAQMLSAGEKDYLPAVAEVLGSAR
ncbi:MAG: hypothetical protein WC891_08620 [Actinomycetota bacterium]